MESLPSPERDGCRAVRLAYGCAEFGHAIGGCGRRDSGQPLGMRLRFVVVVLLAACGSCAHVKPNQRERLASPAMQFEMDPVVGGQSKSIQEITEGSSCPSAGPGTAGAGCGCN